MNYQQKLEEIINNIPKGKVPKLLLHACCAPCSSYCIEYLSNYFDITIYYYNPNISPEEEFNKRVEEIKRFVGSFKTENKVKYVIEHYDASEFEKAIKGHEDDDEGKERCFICYNLRLEASAKYAKEHNFDYFTTTLSISPYKNSKKLNEIGEKIEKDIGIKYLYADFKKKNGYKRSIELSNEYNLYRQDYCGCKYSKIARDKREKLKEEKILLEQKQIDSKKINTINDNKVSSLYNAFYNKDKKKKIRKRDKDLDMFKFSDIKKGDLDKLSIIKIISFIIKILILAAILIIGIYSFLKAIPKNNSILIPTEEEKASLSELYIYGNHMNIKGTLNTSKEQILDVNLLFVSKNNNTEIDLVYTEENGNISFYISDILNKGFILDNMIIDNYVIFIHVKTDEENLYYSIDNNSGYDETTYYAISDENVSKKIIIEDETKYDSMAVNISKSTDEVYDIIIDPGHGGNDPGACYNNKCETDYTLMLSELLKEDLEKRGFKVALTKYDTDWIDKYGETGRVTKAYESNAKLLLSIHLNSSTAVMNGFELYTSNHLDYTFARNVIKLLNEVNDFTYSYNPFSRVENGIYTRTFAYTDVYNVNKDADEKGYIPYNVSTDTNYYFMIRETGGYMAGAYIDGRDGEAINPYVLSNRGLESYILELGYITSKSDLSYIDEYKEEYMSSVSDAITSYFNK